MLTNASFKNELTMDGSFGRKIGIALGLAAVAISVASRDAHAYPFYFDVQGGLGEFMGTTSPLFNTGNSGSTGIGTDFGFGLFYTPLEPRGGFDFQFGIQNLLLTATQDSNNLTTLVPYGAIRVQLWMAYATVGLSPFVWRRNQPGAGLDPFSMAPSTLAYLTEVGLLYAATPKFSLGGSLNLQWYTSSGVLSTQPGASLNFVMRFYFNLFGIGQDGPGGGDPLEYQGWRYIGK